ncbi:MAG TPA: peptide ABC transporter substrate-binding protein [Oceanobacillus sp.]|nr:peptide ABC transporter substrate-binding protein [Oceanobacillus sp.]
MFRGFRWQLAALLLAAGLFVISLLLRENQQIETPPDPTPETSVATQEIIDIPATSTPAPTSDAPAEIATYREALVGEVRRLNPVLAGSNPVDEDITSLIFEGLTRTNGYGEPVPALAERWIISSDGLEYIVFLRQDILWQDGIPFTAEDVLYTMSILRDPEFPGPADLGAFWRTVETEKLGDFIVRFRLTQPLGTFLDKLRIGILPEHALRGTRAAQIDDHPFNVTPIGTGPYQLEAFGGTDTIERVDLRVAPVYRQRQEGRENAFAIERLSFHLFDTFDDALVALQNGEVDGLAGRDAEQRNQLFLTANNGDMDMHNQIENTLGVLIFNWENSPYFREVRVRSALASGLNRNSLVERALPNLAVLANSPLMPGSWAYLPDLDWADYNPDAARQLLAQALERIDRGEEAEAETTDETLPEATEDAAPTTYFAFSILTPDNPALVGLAQEIATQWSQLNLSVTVNAVEVSTYQAMLESGDFDVALVEYALGDSADPDVYNFWHQGQYPNGANYGGADDRRISELLERARRDPYGINRVAEYREFQRAFAERVIALPMYYPLFTYVTAARVDGVQLGFIGSPSDRFRNIGEWSVG